jgi:hypothetical protein
VLIEHPVRGQFKLAGAAKPAATALDACRFEVKVPAAETAKQTVTEERNVGSSIPLTDSPDEQVRIFLQSPVISDKVKEGPKKAQGLRREWARARREIGERPRQLQEVAEDQGGLRANLREVPPGTGREKVEARCRNGVPQPQQRSPPPKRRYLLSSTTSCTGREAARLAGA